MRKRDRCATLSVRLQPDVLSWKKGDCLGLIFGITQHDRIPADADILITVRCTSHFKIVGDWAKKFEIKNGRANEIEFDFMVRDLMRKPQKAELTFDCYFHLVWVFRAEIVSKCIEGVIVSDRSSNSEKRSKKYKEQKHPEQLQRKGV